MPNQTKYGVKSLLKQFPTEDSYLDYIFDTLHSRNCSCGGVYKRIKGRKQYQCSKCRYQIAPMAGTIFHKSDTPLSLWFRAILVFSNSKSGISAKYMQRELEVTYKCAWRILNQIRKALKQDDRKLKGEVEIDTGYFGGKGNAGKNNVKLGNVMASKSIVAIAAERNGHMRAEIVQNSGVYPMQSFIEKNIDPSATIITDSSPVFTRYGKTHARLSVNHHKGEYVRGNVHINTVEVFIAHLKRSIKGTFKVVSKQYLQSYLDAFVFHYNNRYSDRQRFASLVGALLQPVK